MVERRAKIAVFGAGMIGLYVGGLLARDADVTLIGRPSMLDPLDGGLRLTDADGMDETITGFSRSTDPAGLAGSDLVLLTVKSMQTAEAADAIAAHAPAGALLISLQNGVSNAELLRSRLPGRTILAGMVPFNVAQLGPNHFHRGTGGGLVLEDSPALAPFEAILGRSFKLRKSSNIVEIQWGKLLVNLNNAINGLSSLSLAEELRQRDYRRSWALAVTEGLELLKAARIEPADPLAMPLKLMPRIMSLPDAIYGYVTASGVGKTRVDPHARSSMADDLRRGRPTEIDYLQGELVRLAARLGRRAPVNARLVELVKAAEAGAPPIAAKALLADLKAAKQR